MTVGVEHEGSTLGVGQIQAKKGKRRFTPGRAGLGHRYRLRLGARRLDGGAVRFPGGQHLIPNRGLD